MTFLWIVLYGPVRSPREFCVYSKRDTRWPFLHEKLEVWERQDWRGLKISRIYKVNNNKNTVCAKPVLAFSEMMLIELHNPIPRTQKSLPQTAFSTENTSTVCYAELNSYDPSQKLNPQIVLRKWLTRVMLSNVSILQYWSSFFLFNRNAQTMLKRSWGLHIMRPSFHELALAHCDHFSRFAPDRNESIYWLRSVQFWCWCYFIRSSNTVISFPSITSLLKRDRIVIWLHSK